jgi:glucose/arabinose dehydrogenase
MERSERMRRARLSVMSVVAVAVLAACLAMLLWWKVEPARSATTVPQGFTDSLVAQVPSPTAMAIAPDGRLFVAQQTGALRVIKNGQLLTKPFVTVTTSASFFRGLLGVTLDPNFSQNRYVYVFYTATSPNLHNRVSRFRARGDVAASGHGEKVLLELPPLGGQSGQYGGALRFGANNKLYVGVGDDTTAANAQSLNTVNGKILRINRDGTIPTTNPFYASTSGNSRAIWALGLRQPFSLDLRSGTPSRMFVNEVGADTWEEVNEVARGANYGWPTHEGFAASPDPSLQNYKNPVFSYQHGTTADTGCAITGGAFYDPTAPTTPLFPAEYQGDYFYADFCGGWIRRLDLSTNTTAAFASGIERPVDLEVAEDGSLYYLFKGTSVPDAVHKIRYAGGAG